MLSRILGFIERAGNALPQPATLFAALGGVVLLLSAVGSWLGWSASHPTNGDTLVVTNLLTIEGLHRIVGNVLTNFVQFPPLAVVLVALLGISVAEHVGLIRALVRLLVLLAPKRAVTALVIFAGVLSHVGSDVGYVLLIPLAGTLFHALGRHPLAGIAAAFAGVSGGFSANVLIGATDVLLGGITQSAAQLLAPGYVVTGLANYFFMASAAIMIIVVGTWITHRVVEPRLGAYAGRAVAAPLEPLSREEKRGLKFTAGFALLFGIVLLAGLYPEHGYLRGLKEPASLLRSLVLTHLVPFIFLAGLGAGLAYGAGARTLRSDRDVVKGMEAAFSAMGPYLVLAFFAAQFIAWFNWSNLGMLLAVNGASSLRSLGLESQPIPLMVALVFFSAAADLVMGSASAKWTLLAPIFVPMFMLLGYSPELVQAAYRIGDSCSNIISPLMTYFPLILTFVHRYDDRFGIGSVIAMMLPYSLAFITFWTLMLVFWIWLELPLGVGAGLYYPAR
ncbi:MAG: AbgT family transporter [Opitutaceae bacterium]|nr:AbgT family transporter [Opitutaceae bacterium]